MCVVSKKPVLQACKDYHQMLQEVYGPTKVLSPYVLSIDAIKDYDAEGKLEICVALLLCHDRMSAMLCHALCFIRNDCAVTYSVAALVM